MHRGPPGLRASETLGFRELVSFSLARFSEDTSNIIIDTVFET